MTDGAGAGVDVGAVAFLAFRAFPAAGRQLGDRVEEDSEVGKGVVGTETPSQHSTWGEAERRNIERAAKKTNGTTREWKCGGLPQ